MFEIFIIDLPYPLVFSNVRFEDILFIKSDCFLEHVLFEVVLHNSFIENIFYHEDFSDLLLVYKKEDNLYSLFFSSDISIIGSDLIERLKKFFNLL